MIVLDANVLLYAYNQEAKQHPAASRYLENLFNGNELVGLPWTSLWAFLRISTHRQVFSRPFSTEEACEILSSWLECPNVKPIGPGPRHWSYLQSLLLSNQVQGPLVMDAVLAALAQEQGGQVASSDKDFSRFDNLPWNNPLKPNPGEPP